MIDYSMIKILNISDTDDGGAIVTMELDRTLIHSIVQEWFNVALKESIDDLEAKISKDEARVLVEENELSSESNSTEEEDDETREWKELILDLSRDEPKSNTDWGGSFTYPHER